MSSFKSRPILFSEPMVNAILDKRKTQTRRALKVQPHGSGSWVLNGGKWHFPNICPTYSINCPYGQVGDHLWVRETWQLHSLATDFGTVVYHASENKSWTEMHRLIPVHLIGNLVPKAFQLGWRPSIFMPRWASRIELEITAISIERLNDISEEDAQSEGLKQHSLFGEWGGVVPHKSVPNYFLWFRRAIEAFKSLWVFINGEESLNANPWVWVITFKVVTP